MYLLPSGGLQYSHCGRRDAPQGRRMRKWHPFARLARERPAPAPARGVRGPKRGPKTTSRPRPRCDAGAGCRQRLSSVRLCQIVALRAFRGQVPVPVLTRCGGAGRGRPKGHRNRRQLAQARDSSHCDHQGRIVCCPPEGYNTRTAAGEKVPVPSKGVHTERTAALKCGHMMLKGVKSLSEGAKRWSTFNSTIGLL